MVAWGLPACAQGTAAGTVIQNMATVNFSNAGGQAQPAVTSNVAAVTVSRVAAVQAAPASGAGVGQAAEVVYYAVTVTNQGNAADTFSLAASSASSPAWTTAVYKDDGAGGGTANDGVRQLGETNLASTTGSLAADAAFKCFVAVTVPAGAARGAVDTTTMTATSQFDGTKRASASFATTVKAADMTISKTVDKAQAAPGDTIRYTITYTNGGSANATSVVVSDTIPAAVDYVANSVSVNGAAKTDAADSDSVTVASGVITVNLGTIAAGAGGSLTFDAKVK
jgi:uncharacterized repeat protein (TIGR01451 family)